MSAPAPLGVKIHAVGEYTMYAWGAVAILVWESSPSVSGVKQLYHGLNTLRDAHGKISLIHLLRPETGLPSAEVRVEFERLSKSLEQSIVCTAILDEREGFIAGAIKAVLTGLLVVSRVRLNIRVFSAVPELVAWLAPLHRDARGERVDMDELKTILQDLRQQLRS